MASLSIVGSPPARKLNQYQLLFLSKFENDSIFKYCESFSGSLIEGDINNHKANIEFTIRLEYDEYDYVDDIITNVSIQLIYDDFYTEIIDIGDSIENIEYAPHCGNILISSYTSLRDIERLKRRYGNDTHILITFKVILKEEKYLQFTSISSINETKWV